MIQNQNSTAATFRKPPHRQYAAIATWVVIPLFFAMASQVLGQATFLPLGVFGEQHSVATDVSADGQVVIGRVAAPPASTVGGCRKR
jgi:hypothetical protein